jgi:hypothetical protein
VEEGLQQRLAANEAAAREINEAIERGLWPGERARQAAFRCECPRLDCNELLALTPGQYERARATPRRFVVARGHQVADVETVVENHADFLVVEKREEAGRLAERRDPRG